MGAKTGYIVGILAIIFFVSVAYLSLSKTRSTDSSLGFENLCSKNGDQWMVMEPWKDGKKISSQECAGCMIADNHFCTAEEYIAYIKSLPTLSAQETSRMMEHIAMLAHGGYQNSVNIHMYNVQFLRELLPNELAFNITEAGRPVTDMEIVHDKIMHLILVRSDLKYFDHIHPQQIKPGIFSVPYEFLAPGVYRIWADFTIDGMQHIVDFDLNVSGKTLPEMDKLSGINVRLNMLEKITIGKNTLIFSVTDTNDKPLAITEKFLAADAHMIVIDESLEEFGHTHDEDFNKDNILSFEYKFIKSGLHKLWVQFSVNGKERIAEFVVQVNE